MPGYIQNPYMPQYGGFQYGNYPVQPNLSASQCQQNAYLISQLRPNPVPAFQVANPFASMYTGCCNNNVAI